MQHAVIFKEFIEEIIRFFGKNDHPQHPPWAFSCSIYPSFTLAASADYYRPALDAAAEP